MAAAKAQACCTVDTASTLPAVSWYIEDEDSVDVGWEQPSAGLIFSVSLLTAVATMAALYYSVGLPRSLLTTVPPLVGQPLEAAQLTASNAGVGVVVTGQQADPLVTAGAVSRQVPLAGTRIARGGTVGLVISTGRTPRPTQAAASSPDSGGDAPPPTEPEPDAAPDSSAGPVRVAAPVKVKVPRVVRLRLSAARRRLEGVGLRVGRIRYRVDEDVAQSKVLEQQPEAGQRLPPGSRVDLTVNETD